MDWTVSHRADPRGRRLYSRHYSCPDPEAATRQFVPPGSCLVLLTPEADAVWTTSAPIAAYVKHAWAGAWVCSLFRNEGAACASRLIREAVAVTLWRYGEPPPLGMVTFVDPRRVPGHFARTREGRELRWGYSFWKAGFRFCGWTKGGLYALQLLPAEMPEPAKPRGAQIGLFGEEAA